MFFSFHKHMSGRMSVGKHPTKDDRPHLPIMNARTVRSLERGNPTTTKAKARAVSLRQIAPDASDTPHRDVAEEDMKPKSRMITS